MLNIIPLRTAGNTKKIVFLPYAGGYAAAFHQYANNFDEKYDLLAIEYPGRNKNSLVSPTLTFHDLCLISAELIRKIANPHTCLVGVSMGGYIAFKVAQIFETIFQQPLKHIYLLSVRNESYLLSSLSDAYNWYKNIGTISMQDYDPELEHHIKELMMYDRAILMTMKLDNFFLMKTPLTIINGEKDDFCHTLITKEYWENRAMYYFNYKTYPGGHIPRSIDLNQLIFE